MRISLIGLVCLFTSSMQGLCQSFPVYNSYFANPYVYNPASVATDYTQVFVHHRQQWLGIEGSPVNSLFTLTTLVNDSRAGLGFKVNSFQRGLLNTSDVSFAYAYGIHTNKRDYLFFGLSAGAITTRVDVNAATDPSDPVFATYQANNFQATGSFGLLYQSASGVNFGFALPQLFSPSFVEESFSTFSPRPFDIAIGSISYRKKLEGKMLTKKLKGLKTRAKDIEIYAPLEFSLLYKYSAYATSQFEAMAKINLSQNFWVGASYRQAYGVVAHTGFTVKKLALGYSFEVGSQPASGFSQGTHEVFASLRMGEKKKFRKDAPVFRSTLTSPSGTQHRARFQHQVDDPEHLIDEAKAPEKKRYYVVVRTFLDFAAADAYKKKLISEKYNAEVFYYPKNKLYHVHVFTGLKSSEAYEEMRNLKNYTKLKDAKVLVVEEK